MRSTATAAPPGAILYVDHARHLTPLTLCYHATASRHLTSGRTDVVPPSTAVEVDSAYCPRCLTFCDTASASLGVCQKDLDVDGGSRGGVSCKDCPVCFSPVSISIDAKNNDSKDEQHTQLVCHYLCGYCQWSSQECGVTSNADKLLEYATPSDAEIDIATEKDAEKQRQIIIAQLSRELEMCLQQKISERNNPCNELFRSITNTCVQREQEEERRSRMRMGAGTTSKGRVNSLGVSGGWSLESLEQSLLEKKKELDSPWIASEPAHTTSPEVEDDKTNAVPKEQHQHILPTSKQSSAQMVITTTTPRFRSDLLPLPVPFRARVSRRCLAELAVGKTGILIKPKLNPLEGDSSLRAGHGQWWKKVGFIIFIKKEIVRSFFIDCMQISHSSFSLPCKSKGLKCCACRTTSATLPTCVRHNPPTLRCIAESKKSYFKHDPISSIWSFLPNQ